MKNKICMITGANSGIGKETAKALAQMGAYVIMVCRNEEKAERAKQDIIDQTGQEGIEIMIADLAHQYDIRNIADEFNERFDALDVLINNAGLILAEREKTPEGVEKTFAINHLGPFLLTNLLLDKLKNAEHARVVNVSSEAHRLGAPIFDMDNLQLQTGFTSMKAYGLSKLCNIMFTRELAKRTADHSMTTNCLHPGVVNTQLADDATWVMKLLYFIGKPFMRSAKSGAQTSIYLATSDEVNEINGEYFKNKRLAKPAKIALDEDLNAKLWQRSEELCGMS